MPDASSVFIFSAMLGEKNSTQEKNAEAFCSFSGRLLSSTGGAQTHQTSRFLALYLLGGDRHSFYFPFLVRSDV